MTYITTETHGHILTITLDRQESRNAFNRAMADEMEQIIDDYEADTELRCAIICAKGPTFSAGQDLKAALKGEFAATPKRGGFGIMSIPPEKPLIAAVDGQALAGGMELTLCCDIIVASEESIFGLAEAKRGLVAIGGGCFRLPHRIPHNIAMEMVITAEPKSAQDMQHFGYVNSVVKSDQVMGEAMRYAELIARNGPIAVKASKALAYRSATEQWTDEQAWKEQGPIVQPMMSSEDRIEGMKAFAEKRDPVWTGK
ncbi:crotonase/enoyl-CoA hydratase family protein [uncultured Parasphingorhabdus sp.]|uniref:crotonase/enoyl-CoA hydratase family protein n=1 Tax=uncultured Parasphingorhabdus sp. TaxID=2709694 RepID=UPI002AA902B1|nr:crotonase/enoyl-CoA hydratase family protein [uncultured Parasphingorhabdus sp.]